ncbi:MAG: hypothetical protein LBK02_04140 [Treponema sp.]|nr:hypothetical protein [Treponema sp.]
MPVSEKTVAFFGKICILLITMNITDVSYKVDSIVDDLFISADKDRIEQVFSEHDINDPGEKIQLLRKCMRVIDTSNTGEDLSPADEYEDEVAIFVEGSWRFLI